MATTPLVPPGSSPAAPRRRSPGRPSRAAMQITAGLLLMALAGCGEMGPASTPYPVVTIAPAVPVAEGSPLKFMVRAHPAPPADLTVAVAIASPGCTLTQAPKSVTIAAGMTEATLTVPTSGAWVGAEGCTVTATIAPGAGYRVGATTAASASATLTPESTTPGTETPGTATPAVTVTASASSVTEGSTVSFTLTAAPPPASALTVSVNWSESGSFLPANRPQTVTVPTSGTGSLTVTLPNDDADEPDGSVTVTVEAGSGYAAGTPASATVAVTDDDAATTGGSPSPPQPDGPLPVVTVTTSTSAVTEGGLAEFTLTAVPPPASTVTVNLKWGEDFGTLPANKPETVALSPSGMQTFSVRIVDNSVRDSHARGISVHVRIGDGYTVGHPSYATVAVHDNDG